MLIVLAAGVSAALNNSDGWFSYRPDGTLVDETSTFTATNNGCVNTSGVLDRGYYCSSDGQEINTTMALGQVSNFSISFWINVSTNGIARHVIGDGTTSTTNVFGLHYATEASGLDPNFYLTGTFCSLTGLGVNMGDNKWQHFALVYNASDMLVYINGTFMKSCSKSGFQTLTKEQIFGFTDTNGRPNIIDEIGIYINRTLTPSEIITLYNDGSAFNPYAAGPAPSSDQINITTPQPVGNALLTNRNVRFNISVNATNSYNVSLFLAGALNTTQQYGAGNGRAEFNLTLLDGNYTYNMTVFDATSQTNTTNSNFGVDTISLGATGPTNINESFNTNPVQFNITFNSTTSVSCDLFINGTINQTGSYSNGTGVLAELNVSFGTNAEYSYFFGCNNSNGGSENSTTIVFFFDITPPAAVTNFTNRTFFFQNLIDAHWNLSDDINLFSINVTVDNSIEVFNITNLNTTNYQFNLTYNTSGLSIGGHSLNLRFADGHTAEKLGGDYDWKNGLFNDYLRFEFWDYGYVKISNPQGSIFDSFKAQQLTDRYSFTYEPSDDSKTTYHFEIESDLKIEGVSAPGKYNDRWLVIGNHWLDFVLEDDDVDVILTRITDYKYLVSIDKVDNADMLKFSSVGDLNVVTLNYNFTVTNASVSFVEPVLEKQNQTITLTINKSGTINNTGANLFYNGVNTTTNKSTLANVDIYTSTFTTIDINISALNVTINWTYDIFGTLNNENGQIINTQTILQIGVDNCTDFEMRAVNFSVLLENNETLINSNIAGFFDVWVSDSSNARSFNLTWNGVTNDAGICIFPNWTSFRADAQIEYQDVDETFAKKTYYFTNATLDNQTDLVSLFLTNGTSLVTFNVVDENDDAVQDVIIKVLSYDLTTDSFETTEILKTDSDGTALGQLILNTQWYQFILEFEGKVVLLTEPTKLTSTTRTFRINLVSDYFANYDVFLGATTSLTFNNATNRFRYTYSDPSGNVRQGCLRLVRRSVNGDSEVNQSCTSSAASTIILTIPSPVGSNLYIGTGSVGINPTFVTDVLEHSFDQAWRQFGLAGVFVSLLIVLALALAGLPSFIISIVLAVVGLVFVNMLGFYHLNWSILVGLVISAGIFVYRTKQN